MLSHHTGFLDSLEFVRTYRKDSFLNIGARWYVLTAPCVLWFPAFEPELYVPEKLPTWTAVRGKCDGCNL